MGAEGSTIIDPFRAERGSVSKDIIKVAAMPINSGRQSCRSLAYIGVIYVTTDALGGVDDTTGFAIATSCWDQSSIMRYPVGTTEHGVACKAARTSS